MTHRRQLVNYRKPINDPTARVKLERKITRSFNKIESDRKKLHKRQMTKRWLSRALRRLRIYWRWLSAF